MTTMIFPEIKTTILVIVITLCFLGIGYWDKIKNLSVEKNEKKLSFYIFSILTVLTIFVVLWGIDIFYEGYFLKRHLYAEGRRYDNPFATVEMLSSILLCLYVLVAFVLFSMNFSEYTKIAFWKKFSFYCIMTLIFALLFCLSVFLIIINFAKAIIFIFFIIILILGYNLTYRGLYKKE